MADPTVGSTLVGCRIEAVAGRGGMGVVYRARQLELDRLVAVKAIAPGLAADESYRARFKREARLAASIDHPNIIPIYATGEADGTLYLIMRWVDGIDLRALLRREGSLPPSQAIALLEPVASALAAAHRRGLVHRDVKPANVLLSTEDGRDHVHLTDFGIARRTDATSAVTRAGVMVGSLDYMAPERIQGQAGGPPADIYSFGCMLFEALTGNVPFPGDTELAKLHAHVNTPPPLTDLAGLPAPLAAVVTRSMAKDPADRYADAQSLATALIAAGGGTAAETVASEPAVAIGETMPTSPAGLTGVGTSETEALPGGPPAPRTVARPAPPPPEQPAPARGPGRRRVLLLVGAAAVLITGGVVIFTATTKNAPRTVPETPPPTVHKPAKQSAPRVLGIVALGAGSHPDGLFYDGRLLAAESGLGAVAVIDPRTRRLGRPFRVGSDPDSIAGDSTSLWVTNTGSDSVSVLTAGGGARRDVRVGRRPEGVALGFGSAWVANTGDDTISRVDLVTKRPSAPIAVGASPVFVLTAYGSVWTANSGGNTVSRIDPATGRVVASISVGRNPRALAAQDGLWVANGDSGTVSRIDPTRQAVRHTTRSFARGLKGLVADRDHGVVWVSDPDRRRLWRVTTTPGHSDRVLAPRSAPGAPWSLVRTDDGIWASETTGTGVISVPDR